MFIHKTGGPGTTKVHNKQDYDQNQGSGYYYKCSNLKDWNSGGEGRTIWWDGVDRIYGVSYLEHNGRIPTIGIGSAYNLRGIPNIQIMLELT